MSSHADKCRAFAALHQQAEAFVIPNPWDIGSAGVLESMGFKALATTSAGLAYSLGKQDGQITLEEKLQHCTSLAAATSIPINVDFENGFADDPETVAANVLRVAATGVAGCSVEDFNRDTKTLYDLSLSVERIQAAAAAVASLGMPFQLTARAENLLRGVDDLDDTIHRLQAYQAAGAQVLYAPGIKTLAQLHQVTAAIDAPFNVLAPFMPNATVADFAAAGAQRISVGGALHAVAQRALQAAGHAMLANGSFTWVKP